MLRFASRFLLKRVPVTISKEAIEAAARAIASSKRRPEERSELIIDRVWSSYVGMARDALAAAIPFLSLKCNEVSEMTERAYTLSEIESMRACLDSILTPRDTAYYRKEIDAMIENQLRTYMAGGIDPKDLEKRKNELDEARFEHSERMYYSQQPFAHPLWKNMIQWLSESAAVQQ